MFTGCGRLSKIIIRNKMHRNKYDLSKRDFLKKSLALSAGLMCIPGRAIFSGRSASEQVIYNKIAMFQEETARGIMCRICPNECVLKEGELSKCNNRKVNDSKLYTIAFGNPCTVNVDPVEKKPSLSFFAGIKSIFHCDCRM